MTLRRVLSATLGGAAALALAVAIPVAASASSHQSAAPEPHLIGIWSDDVLAGGPGGYAVWNTGKVVALNHAPYFGSVKPPVTDIVGFAADTQDNGYWLIAANGAVFSKGSTCESETLVGPKVKPTSGVVGVYQSNNGNEGFTMVNAFGRLYPYMCQFID
jgi:hypothetical protein